jgi:hypothetical protein
MREPQSNDDRIFLFGRPLFFLLVESAPLIARSAADLEKVSFYRPTNINNGELTRVPVLPRLQYVSLQSRRHPSHKWENFALSVHASSKVMKYAADEFSVAHYPREQMTCA